MAWSSGSRDANRRAVAIVGIAVLVLTALVLSGCGGSASTSSSGGSETEAASDGALPEKIPSTVVVGMPAKVNTVDPTRTIQEVDVMSAGLVSGTLNVATPDGPKPLIAKKCEFTKGLVVYECSIKPGLKFSDGSPIKNTDVVASMEYALNEPANVNAGLYQSIAKVEAKGKDAVVFTLNEPEAALPLALTEAPFGIFPAAGLEEGKSFFAHPVVSGTYELVSIGAADTKFTRNPNYPGAEPLVENVEFREIPDPNTRLLQLQSGQINIAHSLPPNLAKQVQAPAEAHVTSQYGGNYIYVNDREAPLSDPNVRKAISAAVNREQINQLVFLGENTAIGNFFPSTMEGYDESAPVEQNLEKAKELLKGTECENGCHLTIMLRTGFPPYEQMAQIVQQNLEEAGFEVSIQGLDQAAVEQKEANGEFQLQVSGLYDFVNTPELIMLRYGLDFEGGIESLFSGYDSPQMDKLIATVGASQGAKREQALNEINELFLEDMPYVPLTNYTISWGSNIPTRVFAFTASGQYKSGTKEAGPEG